MQGYPLKREFFTIFSKHSSFRIFFFLSISGFLVSKTYIFIHVKKLHKIAMPAYSFFYVLPYHSQVETSRGVMTAIHWVVLNKKHGLWNKTIEFEVKNKMDVNLQGNSHKGIGRCRLSCYTVCKIYLSLCTQTAETTSPEPISRIPLYHLVWYIFRDKLLGHLSKIFSSTCGRGGGFLYIKQTGSDS